MRAWLGRIQLFHLATLRRHSLLRIMHIVVRVGVMLLLVWLIIPRFGRRTYTVSRVTVVQVL